MSVTGITTDELIKQRIFNAIEEMILNKENRAILKQAIDELDRLEAISPVSGELITQAEACRILGKTYPYVKRLIRQGKLKTYTMTCLVSKDQIVRAKDKLDKAA